jgi:hypothetical protein
MQSSARSWRHADILDGRLMTRQIARAWWTSPYQRMQQLVANTVTCSALVGEVSSFEDACKMWLAAASANLCQPPSCPSAPWNVDALQCIFMLCWVLCSVASASTAGQVSASSCQFRSFQRQLVSPSRFPKLQLMGQAAVERLDVRAV